MVRTFVFRLLLAGMSVLFAGAGSALALDPEGHPAEAAAKEAAHAVPGAAEKQDDHKHDAKPAGDHHGASHDLSHANATPELGSMLQFQSDLAIYSFVVFVLLLIILGKFAWGPILKGVQAREQGIAQQIAGAERANAEARAMLHDHQAKLAGSAAEVRRMLDEGKRDAEAAAAKIVGEAQAAAERERDKSLQQIEAAKNAAMRELAEKSVNVAVKLAGQIVQRQLGPQDHAQLVRQAVEQFPSKN